MLDKNIDTISEEHLIKPLRVSPSECHSSLYTNGRYFLGVSNTSSCIVNVDTLLKGGII
jgi:hypothetical protein